MFLGSGLSYGASGAGERFSLDRGVEARIAFWAWWDIPKSLLHREIAADSLARDATGRQMPGDSTCPPFSPNRIALEEERLTD
jgi:hypothetical protein